MSDNPSAPTVAPGPQPPPPRPPAVPVRVLAGVAALALLVFGIALPFILLRGRGTVAYSAEELAAHEYDLSTIVSIGDDTETRREELRFVIEALPDEGGIALMRLVTAGPAGDEFEWPFLLGGRGPAPDPAAPPWPLGKAHAHLLLAQAPSGEPEAPPFAERFANELPEGVADEHAAAVSFIWAAEAQPPESTRLGGAKCWLLEQRVTLTTEEGDVLQASGTTRTWLSRDGYVIGARANLSGHVGSGERRRAFGLTSDLELAS